MKSLRIIPVFMFVASFAWAQDKPQPVAPDTAPKATKLNAGEAIDRATEETKSAIDEAKKATIEAIEKARQAVKAALEKAKEHAGPALEKAKETANGRTGEQTNERTDERTNG